MIKKYGFRTIEPYYHHSKVYCKQRWMGRTVEDVIVEEFKTQPKHEHLRAISEGRVEVVRKGKKLDIDEPMIDGDQLNYKVHWHEPAVTGEPIRILQETDNLVVVNKPAGLPIHPSGKYRYNTLTEIMQKDFGMKVYASHRLDRMTSGLMLLGKNSQAASKFSLQLRDKTVRKEYMAKVAGKFPEHAECDYDLYDLNTNLPFSAISRCISNAKPAMTSFKRVSFDGEYSIVHCYPTTGRMHQIRKHLAILGYPIANDELYNNNEFRILAEAIKNGQDGEQEYLRLQQVSAGRREEKRSGERCPECDQELYELPKNFTLWLHAYKYYSLDDSWSYCSPEVPF